MNYEEFLRKRLFEPLGMTDTTSFPNESQIARIAKSYKANKDQSDLEETTVGQLKYPLNDPSRQPMPAGGFFSTAKDVTRDAGRKRGWNHSRLTGLHVGKRNDVGGLEKLSEFRVRDPAVLDSRAKLACVAHHCRRY